MNAIITIINVTFNSGTVGVFPGFLVGSVALGGVVSAGVWVEIGASVCEGIMAGWNVTAQLTVVVNCA
jgi:hypothetical protein